VVLSGGIAPLTDRIVTLSDRIAPLSDRIAVLSDRIVTLSDRIAALSGGPGEQVPWGRTRPQGGGRRATVYTHLLASSQP
jgi:hypothetical protein